MTSLLLAALAFAGIHLGIAGTPLRAVLVGKMGDQGYRGVFSLLSAAALGWLIWAYGNAPFEAVWAQAEWARHLVMAIMLIAVVLMMVGLTTPNPTSVGQEGKLQEPEAATGIVRITRHPFLWATMLWAVSHMLMNGDMATIILTASILVTGVFGTRSIDARRAALDPDGWARFAGQTSNIPFAAIAAGRNSLKLGELGLWRIGLGLAVYAGLAWGHGYIAGVPLM